MLKSASQLLTLLVSLGMIIALCVVGFVLYGGIFIVIGLVIGIPFTLISIGLSLTLFFTMRPVLSTSNQFMTALKREKYAQAYRLCITELQVELGSAEGLSEFVRQRRLQPQTWKFSSRSRHNDQAQLNGSVTMGNGTIGALQLSLYRRQGQWKISGFQMSGPSPGLVVR